VETITPNARESIAVAAIAGIERTGNSRDFHRPEPVFLCIGVAPFRVIASNGSH
jgi:hypothetical protein